MKFFYSGKDGGEDSNVSGFWLVEIKSLFSIALLKFEDGTREAYHSHAFDCVSWVLKGRLEEEHFNGARNYYEAGLDPIVTRRDTFHKVRSVGRTWVFTLRGPWTKTWKENIAGQEVILTHGRKIVA